jgi:serine/threonine protein kinase
VAWLPEKDFSILGRIAKMTDFLPMEIIGQGGYATVVKVKLRNKPELIMAMKQIEKNLLENEPGGKEQLLNEVQIMESLTHPNIVEFYGYFEDSRHVNLLLEYSEEGCLFSNRQASHYEFVTVMIVILVLMLSTWLIYSKRPIICTASHLQSCTEI